MTDLRKKAAIVDFSLGNLFSVKLACDSVGIDAEIVTDKATILDADIVILPGVGAFRDAMDNLRKLDLVEPLRDIAQNSEQLLVGICLGQQLLMTESYEFGTHQGLGIFDGEVVPFDKPKGEIANEPRILKVPQVGWNEVHPAPNSNWSDSPLCRIDDGENMYFVHSYYVKPNDSDVVLAETTYGDVTFASSLQKGSVFSCQFHPERSGVTGLTIYEEFTRIFSTKSEK